MQDLRYILGLDSLKLKPAKLKKFKECIIWRTTFRLAAAKYPVSAKLKRDYAEKELSQSWITFLFFPILFKWWFFWSKRPWKINALRFLKAIRMKVKRLLKAITENKGIQWTTKWYERRIAFRRKNLKLFKQSFIATIFIETYQ